MRVVVKVDLDLTSHVSARSDHAMCSPSLIKDADEIARSVVGLRENILTKGHDGARDSLRTW